MTGPKAGKTMIATQVRGNEVVYAHSTRNPAKRYGFASERDQKTSSAITAWRKNKKRPLMCPCVPHVSHDLHCLAFSPFFSDRCIRVGCCKYQDNSQVSIIGQTSWGDLGRRATSCRTFSVSLYPRSPKHLQSGVRLDSKMMQNLSVSLLAKSK